MGQPVHCRITVRTPVTWGTEADHPPWFIEKMYDHMYEFTDIDGSYSGDSWEWEIQGALNYGIVPGEEVDDILEILRELGIPFETHQESTPEWGEEMELFDGSDSYSSMTVSDWPVLEHSTWESIKQASGAGTKVELVAWQTVVLVDEYFDRRQRRLHECDIQHLGHLCPPDPATRVTLPVAEVINAARQAMAFGIEQRLLYGKGTA
jgi:hypothetical protein